MAFRALLAAVLCCAAPASPGGVTQDDADRLARRVEERHARANDLTAHFTQTYRSGLLGRELVESGVLSLKRPGRIRWEYRDPEKKIFVSDGKTAYFYVPADRQVVVREQADERSLPSLLLFGRGELRSHFRASLEAGSSGAPGLRLVPRAPDPEISSVLLDVDASGRILGIELEDAQGNLSRFRFEEMKEDVGLSDRLFEFQIPRDVELIKG